MGVEGYLVSPAVFKTVEGGDPALVSSILTCSRQSRPREEGGFFLAIAGQESGFYSRSLALLALWFFFLALVLHYNFAHTNEVAHKFLQVRLLHADKQICKFYKLHENRQLVCRNFV